MFIFTSSDIRCLQALATNFAPGSLMCLSNINVCVAFLKYFTASLHLAHAFCWNALVEYHTASSCTAVTCVHGSVNLTCTFQIWAVFLHPYTAYQQLKFCEHTLHDLLCKWAKFQMMFQLTNQTIPWREHVKLSSQQLFWVDTPHTKFNTFMHIYSKHILCF